MDFSSKDAMMLFLPTPLTIVLILGDDLSGKHFRIKRKIKKKIKMAWQAPESTGGIIGAA